MSNANESPGTGFDFKDWITANGLQDIEHIFVKHDLTKLSNLCTQSTQFTSFISDPILLQTQQHLIPTAVKSIQKLSNITTQKPQYVIITKKEQNGLQSLKSHLQQLESHELLNNQMYHKYVTDIDIIKNRKTVAFENAQHKIKTFFEKLNTEIALKQELLLKQLESMYHNNIENEENKESETSLWLESKTLISKQTAKLNEAINSINKIIQSTKENSEEREPQITNILAIADAEFNESQNILDSNRRFIENSTQGNNLYEFDVDLKLNKYEQHMLNIIKNIHITAEPNENNEGMSSFDETGKSVSHYQQIINKQQKEISEYQKTIYSLQIQIANFYVPENKKKKRKKKKKKKSMKPMVEYCKSQRNGDTLWNATLHFIGKQETAAGNSKKNARHNCIRKFEARYSMNDNELDILWNVL